MVDNLDPALVSRCVLIEVPLPSRREVEHWWKQKAKHLKAEDHTWLAFFSTLAGASFRDLENLIDDQDDQAASQAATTAGSSGATKAGSSGDAETNTETNMKTTGKTSANPALSFAKGRPSAGRKPANWNNNSGG